MALPAILWRLASPYDAYVSHAAKLTSAMERIRSLSEAAVGHEAGLRSSVRYVPGGAAAEERQARFRERLGTAAAQMSDAEFEHFLETIGGGDVASVESDRARAATRLAHATRGVEEYFVTAGQELLILERRGFNPNRPDVARQLRENHIPPTTLEEYRAELHELGRKVGKPDA